MIQQADLLFLPNDKGFKYLLVVVDLGSRLTDATPLRTKSASAILNGFKKIYEKNKVLGFPKRIEVDDGGEFKSVVKNWFVSKDVYVRYGKAGRSQQQALAERRNQEIQREIFIRQLIKEIETNKVSKLWIKYLDEILDDMNERYELKKQPKPKYDVPIITKNNKDLLMKGDKVRIMIDKPVDYFGNKLSGNFRTGDIRWSPKLYAIDKVLLRPNYPPLYLVDGLSHTTYTRGQLKKI